MSQSPIEFWFDFISPNAYLGWKRIYHLVAPFNRPVQPVPVLFAGLLGAHQRRGPAEVRPMARWMARNCLRKAAELGIPFRAPHAHPFNPLLCLRAATAIDDIDEQQRAIDALFDAVWGEGRNVTVPETVAAALDAAGLPGKEIVERAEDAKVKQRLRQRTEAAVERGVFGVPTVAVNDELFWGFDDFRFVQASLGGSDPLPVDEWRRWARVKPSAMRREVSGNDQDVR